MGYIANTDFKPYRYVSSRTDLDEVNFSQPSGSWGFRVITPGASIFFKLVRLADRLDIDILSGVEAKMEGNGLKCPAAKVRGSSKKYTAYEVGTGE